MNKSQAYKLAQLSVLRDECASDTCKLDVLRVLMEAEDLAEYCEKQKEKEKEE